MDPIRYQLKRNLNGNLELDLRRCRLETVPSKIFRYPAIKTLILKENFLEYLPHDIAMLASLNVLQLQKNNLISIPKEIIHCHQLQYLDLTSNKLLSFPHAIIFLKQLRILKMANNQIKDIPYQIGSLNNLRKFDLHKNKLQNLPNSMACLKKLKEIDLSQNLFDQLPLVICSLGNTKSLNLSRNLVTHIIPCMDNMKNLQELNISYNNLITVCLSLTKLKKMKYLDLSYNQLTEVPGYLQQLPYLRILNVQGNKIKHVPRNFTSLMYLNLSDNQIYNFSIGKMKKLLSLNISYNRMSQLPYGIVQLKRLEHLIVSNNQINSIPYEIVKLKHLRTLDISNNRLTSIPSYISQITSLEYCNTTNCNCEADTNTERYRFIVAKRHFMDSIQKNKYSETKFPKHYSTISLHDFVSNRNSGTTSQYTQRTHSKGIQSELHKTTKSLYKKRGGSIVPNKYQIWSDTNVKSIPHVINRKRNLDRGYQWLKADKVTDSKQHFHSSDSTSGFADEIGASSVSDTSSNNSTVSRNYDWIEPGAIYEETTNSDWPTTQYSLEENTTCECCHSNKTANPRPNGLIKVFKEIFSISCEGGEFVSSDGSNISLHIPSINVEHLQVTMQAVNISENAIESAQIQEPLLKNILSISLVVMLTPNTDIPFTIPINISLPAPPTLEDEEASGCLHVLTAKDDNTCTPFFRNYTLENGYITLQTYHLAGKVAVITKSKCQYKACKCTESLLMMLLS